MTQTGNYAVGPVRDLLRNDLGAKLAKIRPSLDEDYRGLQTLAAQWSTRKDPEAGDEAEAWLVNFCRKYFHPRFGVLDDTHKVLLPDGIIKTPDVLFVKNPDESRKVILAGEVLAAGESAKRLNPSKYEGDSSKLANLFPGVGRLVFTPIGPPPEVIRTWAQCSDWEQVRPDCILVGTSPTLKDGLGWLWLSVTDKNRGFFQVPPRVGAIFVDENPLVPFVAALDIFLETAKGTPRAPVPLFHQVNLPSPTFVTGEPQPSTTCLVRYDVWPSGASSS